MKKFLALLLGLSLVIGLAACDPVDPEDNDLPENDFDNGLDSVEYTLGKEF